MPEALSSEEIAARLPEGWEHRSPQVISRTWEAKGFNGVAQLAGVVAYVANRANHHPDITMHDYNRLTVTSTTHDAGAVTDADLDLAGRINAVLAAAG
jgi:4a-hydroxytetrahydrobiopterin dehydratase